MQVMGTWNKGNSPPFITKRIAGALASGLAASAMGQVLRLSHVHLLALLTGWLQQLQHLHPPSNIAWGSTRVSDQHSHRPSARL